MKDKYYPNLKRASKEHKRQLIKQINISEPSELPDNCVGRRLTLNELRNTICILYSH